MKKRENIIFLLTIVFSILYLVFGHKAATKNPVDFGSSDIRPQKVKVTQIIDPEYHKVVYGEFQTGDEIILFEAEYTKGFRKGDRIQAVQSIDSMYAIEMRKVQPGDTIIIYENQNTAVPEVKFMFAEYQRVNFIWFLCGVFVVILLVMGRRNGVNTLVSLFFTIASIFYVFIPAVLSGGNIYIWSISTCIYIIIMTLLIISGFSRKSLAAMIGCSSGVLVAGVLTVTAQKVCHMTGLTTEDSLYLLFLNPENPIDLKAIVFAAIILGAVGAIMDVSMSLSSSLSEMKEQVGNMTSAQLTRSGMVIGRDIMGTMANTLILAYIGSSLSVTLLLAAYNANNPMLLFNGEMILVELLQAVAGSLGILLTIPLTSIVCGILYRGDHDGK